MWENPSDDTLRKLLKESRVIAVVGCSPSPDRTSHLITQQMQHRGFRIIPIHPAGGTILGETVYESIEAVPSGTPIDIVNVFRRAEETVPVAQAAARLKTRALWLQQGIVNEDAATIATAAGLVCVMDACIAVVHRVLVGNG